MRRKLSSGLPEPLERARGEFARWRHLPKADRRIPERLWLVASEAAGRHGVSRTARTLGVSYVTLKERLEATTHKAPGPREGSAAFVELVPPALAGAAECVVELEDRRGARMRIQLRGASTPDLTALTKAFWGSEG